MREEIAAAVVFLIRLLRQQNDSIPKTKIDEFSDSLSAALVEKFKNHWYKDKPAKGQGYRCIRINAAEPIDPVLEKAATDCGLEYKDLNLPSELTVWVDPHEVCCRFGEHHGSFCTLASFKDGNIQNKALTINLEEMLEKQKKEQNQQTNYVTTRTNNRGKDNSRRNGPHFPGSPPHYDYHNTHQHNFYYNQNQHQYPPPPFPPPNFLPPPPPPPPPPYHNHGGPGQHHGGGRPFHGGHKPHLKANGNMNNNGSFHFNNNNQNNNININSSNSGMGPSVGGPHQGRTFQPKHGDRYHWVKGRNHGNSHKTQ